MFWNSGVWRLINATQKCDSGLSAPEIRSLCERCEDRARAEGNIVTPIGLLQEHQELLQQKTKRIEELKKENVTLLNPKEVDGESINLKMGQDDLLNKTTEENINDDMKILQTESLGLNDERNDFLVKSTEVEIKKNTQFLEIGNEDLGDDQIEEVFEERAFKPMVQIH